MSGGETYDRKRWAKVDGLGGKFMPSAPGSVLHPGEVEDDLQLIGIAVPCQDWLANKHLPKNTAKKG
jgi:hypothetical protein